MDELRAHIKELEERLFEPAVRSSRTALEELLSPDFREIGSSGRMYDFEEIVGALLNETPVISRKLEHFSLMMLGEWVGLATYRAVRIGSDGSKISSLRSSIWRRETDGRWRMVFHQGTSSS